MDYVPIAPYGWSTVCIASGILIGLSYQPLQWRLVAVGFAIFGLFSYFACLTTKNPEYSIGIIAFAIPIAFSCLCNYSNRWRWHQATAFFTGSLVAAAGIALLYYQAQLTLEFVRP